jgi:hypothetical protein
MLTPCCMRRPGPDPPEPVVIQRNSPAPGGDCRRPFSAGDEDDSFPGGSILDTLLSLSRRGDIYRTLIRMRAAHQRNGADPQRASPGRAGGRDVPHPIRVRRRSKPRSRLTQPEPTSGRASLHRYSPGGECDGNEYGGLPVNPVVLHQMNQLPIPRCTDGSNAPPNGPRGCLGCPFANGQRQVAVVASQVEHVSITVVSGRVSSGNGSLTCRSLAIWLMPRACGTTPSWCPRR